MNSKNSKQIHHFWSESIIFIPKNFQSLSPGSTKSITDGMVSTGSYPRDNLKRTQTPQGFRIGDICDLHREALEKGVTNSVASCTLMIELGRPVYFSKGSEKNIKLTTVEDIDIFKALLMAKRSEWLKD